MLIVWVCISGEQQTRHFWSDWTLTARANRAQFADVSLRHVDEDEEVDEVSMPTVQGRTDGGELNRAFSLSPRVGDSTESKA